MKSIPKPEYKRIVVIGGGFAGINLVSKLRNSPYQIVLIDKFNYHQFQPLFYQVAMAGLEPSSISFPLRKLFQGEKNVFIRKAEVQSIDTHAQQVHTDIGSIKYDYLVLAMGVDTNYFGMQNIAKYAYPMKSVGEALGLRNRLLQNFEDAQNLEDVAEKTSKMSVVIVGGGPTGVELAGALAEMRKFVLPKDHPELDFSKMRIILVEAGPRLLNGMSEVAGKKAVIYLHNLGVEVMLNAQVCDYDGLQITFKDGSSLFAETLIWAAGVAGKKINGLPDHIYNQSGRIITNEINAVKSLENVFCIGDQSLILTDDTPKGHPQLAQVAIQQANNLAENLKRMAANKPTKAFRYRDLGSMATIGRHLAVADLPFIKFQGFFAWLVWMFVHLMAILGVKNKILVFINWAWNYVTFDQSLRLIIRAVEKPFSSTHSKAKVKDLVTK
jgi:NADH dehydrogenase